MSSHASQASTSTFTPGITSYPRIRVDHYVHSPGNPTIRDRDTGAELERHSDLWFEDGSVVCRAETTLFRVHISQLSRHSICFRDMFALATASASSASNEDGSEVDVLDNCPVIFLYDKADDVASLFTAIYDGPCVQ